MDASSSGSARCGRPGRAIDPDEPLGQFWEEERTPGGGTTPALTVFLAGAECPFTCVFCDLWRETLDGPTPRGALPEQIRKALAAAGPLPGPGGAEALQRQQLLRAAGGAAARRDGDPRPRRPLRPRHRRVPSPPDRRPLPPLRRAAGRPPGGGHGAGDDPSGSPAAPQQGDDPRRLRPRRRQPSARPESDCAPSCWSRPPSCHRRRRSSGRSARPSTPSSAGRSGSR